MNIYLFFLKFILLSLLFLNNGCSNPPFRIITKWNSGIQKDAEIISTKKINFGEIHYYENGAKKYEIINKGSIIKKKPNSKQINIEKHWFSSGKIAYIEKSINGKLVFGNYYNQSGKIESKIRNQTGKRILFFNNGKVMLIDEIINDLIINGKYFNSKGELISKIENGTGTMTKHYLSGELFMKADYINSLEHGQVIWYFESGVIRHKYEAENGECKNIEILWKISEKKYRVENTE